MHPTQHGREPNPYPSKSAAKKVIKLEICVKVPMQAGKDGLNFGIWSHCIVAPSRLRIHYNKR
jgi:hypothetical protein